MTGDVTLDTAALDAWIGDRLPERGNPLVAERIDVNSGIANALFIVERGDHR